MTPKALIVVTCYLSHDCIEACVDALSKQTRSDFQVVLVENDDVKDGSDLSKLNLPGNMRVIQNPSNTGFSGGNNLGVLYSKSLFSAEWVITLNPDAFPAPDWFETLMRYADIAPEYAMLSSTLLREQDPSVLDGAGDVYSIYGISWRGGQGLPLKTLAKTLNSTELLPSFPVLGPCGAAAAYRSNVFESAGGFDETYFCYLEDVDLALRLQLQGHKCLHCVEATVLHRSGASSAMPGDAATAFKNYHTHKNQLRLLVKNIPLPLLILMLPVYSLCLAWVLFRTRRQSQSTHKVRGLKDGIKGLRETLKARKQIQKRRTVSAFYLARRLAWSPSRLRHKRI